MIEKRQEKGHWSVWLDGEWMGNARTERKADELVEETEATLAADRARGAQETETETETEDE